MRDAAGNRKDESQIIERNRSFVYRLFHDKTFTVGLCLATVILLISLLAPFVASKNPTTLYPNGISATGGPLGPSHSFLLGTDQFGHDELSRLLWGGRTAILVSLLSSSIASFVGLILGAMSGLAGGGVDTVISRFINILMSFPLTLFAVAMVMILKPSIINLIIIMSVIFWTYTARLVRAEVLTLRELDFVTAARSLGAGSLYIVTHHIVPNVLDTVMVRFTLSIAQTFLLESGLSYLGAGVQPPTPDWGLMIAQSQNFYQQDPALIIYPGLAIILTVVAFNFVGQGIQKSLFTR